MINWNIGLSRSLLAYSARGSRLEVGLQIITISTEGATILTLIRTEMCRSTRPGLTAGSSLNRLTLSCTMNLIPRWLVCYWSHEKLLVRYFLFFESNTFILYESNSREPQQFHKSRAFVKQILSTRLCLSMFGITNQPDS